MLTDSDVYVEAEQSWEEVVDEIKIEAQKEGFAVRKGIPYLYGIYKAKKKRWRPIAGVRQMEPQQRMLMRNKASAE